MTAIELSEGDDVYSGGDYGDDSDDGDAKPSTLSDTESKTELFPLSLMLEHEQREVVFKALKKAKQIHNLETSSQSIWLICKEYINE
jgi:hypothetical protein